MSAILHATIPRLLSPSAVSPVPRLETEFLDHWVGAIDSSELISQEYRGVLQDLVKTKAPLSVFADALFFGLAERWVLDQGIGKSYSWHGVERIFQPFPISGKEQPSSLLPEHPINLDEILDRFTEHDPKGDLHANKVLEFNSATIYTSQFFPFNDWDHWAKTGTATVRIPSLSFMASALRYFFGDQALLPCLAKGEISRQDARDLHKEGYHPVGLPDFSFANHDLMHLVLWSANVPFWVQTATCLWHESCEETLKDDRVKKVSRQWTGFVDSSMKNMEDLELRQWDISRPMRVLLGSLSDSEEGRGLGRIVLEKYLRKLDDHFQGGKPAGLVDHKKKIEEYLSI